METMVADREARWTALARPRTPDALVAACVLLLFLAAAAFMPAQNDTWWHLAAGRDIVHRGAVHLVDPFSWTAGGRYWSNHEWLSQVIFFTLYRAGGMPLLTTGGVLLVGLTLWLLWRLMSGPPLLRTLLLLLLATSLVSEWSLRPKLFTLAAMAATLTLLERRRYLWLPLLFAIWANLHGAVALGVVALGAASLEALVHDRRRFPRLALASGLSIAATACTPLGFSLLDDVVLSLRRPDYLHVIEWQPAGTEPWTFGFFLVVAAVAVLVGRFRRALDERERLLVYVSIALTPLAFRFSRNIPIFTLAAGPLLSALLAHADGVRSLVRSSRPRPRPYTAAVATAATAAIGVVGYAWASRAPVLHWDPVPPAAAAAIRGCGRPLYNHFDNGGPLIWFVPEQPVFIDSRQHPYPASFIVEHFGVEDSGDYEALFARYGIRCAVLPPSSPVSQALVRDGWTVLYRDRDWVVAVRP